MRKPDIIYALVQKLGISKKDATTIYNTFIEILENGIIYDDFVDLHMFMKLEKRFVPARQSRNPYSGETIDVPAKYIPKCVFKTTFKTKVMEANK